MSKKKISKNQELTFNDIPRIKLDNKKLKELKEVKPEAFFADSSRVGEALLQCLIDNDPQAFMEILDSYAKS